MFRKLALVAVVAFVGGTAFAGPFFQRRLVSIPPPSSPNFIGQCAESSMQDPMGKEVRVQQPSSLNYQTDGSSSQPPPTVLGPVEGTGSRLLTGLKIPDKITHNVDPEVSKKLDSLVSALQRKQEPVSISLPMEDSTSQRLSRILMILETLLYVVPGGWGLSKVGPFIRLAARLVAGLPSALKEPSPALPPTNAIPSSTQVSGS